MVRFLFLATLILRSAIVFGQGTILEKRTFDGVEIELFRNTDSMSQAIAINHEGSMVGTREILESRGEVKALRTLSFYSGTQGTKDIGVPESFTSFEVIGISDTELIVGYATRPLRHKDGSLRGVVWNAREERFSVLPLGDGDLVNQAQDISADGKRITGYTTGPERLRPVVWDYDEERRDWRLTVLPIIHDNNPYLMSSHLVISPNGKWVAGCCTEEIRPDGGIDSSLFLWTEIDSGNWERKRISAEQMYLHGMNDQRELVGSLSSEKGGRLPCYISHDGRLVMLELLPGDVAGEAKAINNSSVIVGFSDDPIGKEGGPEPCIWSKDGKSRRFVAAGGTYGAISGINDAGQMAGMIELPSESGVTDADGQSLLLAFRTSK